MESICYGIVVVGTLTHCAMLQSMYDLKSTQVNTQHSLIQQLILYEFKLGHNVIEVAKNNCTKCKDAADHRI